MTMNKRIHSTNVEYMRADLAASLEFAIGPDPDPAVKEAADGIVAELVESRDAQTVLRMIPARISAAVFGAVARFHNDAETSLMGHAESLTALSGLHQMGMTVADLRWPADILHWRYIDQAAPTDPAFEARLVAAVDKHRGTYPPEPEPVKVCHVCGSRTPQ